MATRLPKCVLSVLLLSAALFPAGCVIRSDFKPDAQYPSDYVIGAVYRTKVVLIAQRQNWFHLPFLQQPFSVLAVEVPNRFWSVADVQAGTKPYAKTYVVIPQGTLFRFDRFVDQVDVITAFLLGSAIFACGRILDGPLADQEVTLNRISSHDPTVFKLLLVDPTFIEYLKCDGN